MERRLETADEAALSDVENFDLLTAPQRQVVLLRPWCASDAEAVRVAGQTLSWLKWNKSHHPAFSQGLALRAKQLPQIIRSASVQLVAKNITVLAEGAEAKEDGTPKHGWNVFFKAQEEARKMALPVEKQEQPAFQQIQMFSYGSKKADERVNGNGQRQPTTVLPAQ